jgi:hypothetical protein
VVGAAVEVGIAPVEIGSVILARKIAEKNGGVFEEEGSVLVMDRVW